MKHTMKIKIATKLRIFLIVQRVKYEIYASMPKRKTSKYAEMSCDPQLSFHYTLLKILLLLFFFLITGLLL